ncbi:MAG: hypothetical protein GIX02_02495 [Candidatus Eremiobacteraeota bacterium]|nr:hypothetical protein [Candidatus Eremiobacteraeota bacterium]
MHALIAGIIAVVLFAIVPIVQLMRDHLIGAAAIRRVLEQPDMRAVAKKDRQLTCRAEPTHALGGKPADSNLQYVACISPAQDRVWSYDVRADTGSVLKTEQLDDRLLAVKLNALIEREHSDNVAMISSLSWTNAPLRNYVSITVDRALWEKLDAPSRSDLTDAVKGSMRQILLELNDGQPVKDATYEIAIVDENGNRLAQD